MSDRDKWVMLYDFYGELFNERQREYFEEYYFNNLSLAEIGENFNVSRNAIHKVIQGVEEKLSFYEEKLGLYKKSKIICDIIEREKDKDLKKMLEGLI
ncbi:MAG: hypothetical protein IJ509_02885 [Bacilli bacterium]|nr:hypothetical protein [Bacilli bacterium]